jgi:acetyl-CoA C-acetyltransferase
VPDEEAVIVATARSAIGRANKGSLVDYRADELMATILNALMDKVPEVDRADIFDIICGNVAQSGETGFSIARTAGLLAGFPQSVPGLTLNRFCSSSLQSIRSAAHAIRAGEGDVYIAAGVEKSSRPPVPEGEEPPPAPRGRGIGPGGLNPKLLGRDSAFPFVYIPMGMTAENVAERFKVSREDQDAFAKLSQDRAVARSHRSRRRTGRSSTRTTARGPAPRSSGWPSSRPRSSPRAGRSPPGTRVPSTTARRRSS